MAAQKPIIILIAGASGSGKGVIGQTLATMLKKQGIKTATLLMDNYYKPLPSDITKETLEHYPLCQRK